MDSQVERLESELAVAKLRDQLEAAREAMHADRGDQAKMRAYKKAAKALQEARSAHRLTYGLPPAGPGDGVAAPETVKLKTGVQG